MPNQYNTPLVRNPNSTYISQHVGLPLEAMEAALVSRQRSYDSIDQLGINTQSHIAGIEHYGDYAGKYVASKKQEMEDFVSKYDGKDLTSPEISRAFKEKAAEIAGDSELQDIATKSQLVKQFKANIADIKKSGGLYDENIYHQVKALQNYSKTGSFGDVDFDPSVEKGVNIEEEAEKYYKALHADGAETIRKIADGAGGSLYYDQSSSGISGGKIQSQATRLFSEFAKSQAGRQLARRFDMETDGKGSSQQKVQYMAKMFLNAGQGYQYSESKSNMSAALDKKEDLKRKKKEEAATMEVPFVEAGSLANHIELDSKTGMPKGSGGVWERMKEVNQQTGSWKQAIKAGYNHLLDDSDGPVYTDADKATLAPTIDALKEINSARRKNKQPELSPQEYYKARQATTEKKRQLVSSIALDTKTNEGLKKGLVDSGAILSFPAIDPNNPGDKNQTIDSVLRKAMGKDKDDPITPDEMKDMNVQVASLPAKSGYSPKAVAVYVNGKPFIADMGYHMLSEGYVPKDKTEAKELNEYNQAQAELKGGSHIFTGYISDGNKIVPKRVKVVYDPVSGESILKETK